MFRAMAAGMYTVHSVQYCIGTRLAAIGTLLAAGMYCIWALGQESGLAAGMNMGRTDYMDVLGRIQG